MSDTFTTEIVDEAEGFIFTFSAATEEEVQNEIAMWDKFGIVTYTEVRPLHPIDTDGSEPVQAQVPPAVVSQYLFSAE